MQRVSRSWLFSHRLFLSFQRHHVVVNLLQTAVDECHAKVFACRELVREKQGVKCFKEAKQCDTCAEYIELITVGQIITASHRGYRNTNCRQLKLMIICYTYKRAIAYRLFISHVQREYCPGHSFRTSWKCVICYQVLRKEF